MDKRNKFFPIANKDQVFAHYIPSTLNLPPAVRNPPTTLWEIKYKSCCCCCCGPLVKINVPNRKNRFFCRHWEIHLTVPIIVILLILFTTVTHFICVFPYLYFPVQLISSIVIIFFLIPFVYSYFAAMCMDPGFLPFNWFQTQRYTYSWEEQLSGLAVTEEQIEYALTASNRPPQCLFSHHSGRYVIRGDHICGWVQNWIGKRNHKQFLLMCLYGGLFSLSLFSFIFGVKGGLKHLPSSSLLPCIFAASIEIVFALYLLSTFTASIVDLSRNRTKLKRKNTSNANSSNYRNKDKNDDDSVITGNENNRIMVNDDEDVERKVTLKESMQEVCGTRPCCCAWLLPTPAFDDSLYIERNETNTPNQNTISKLILLKNENCLAQNYTKSET